MLPYYVIDHLLKYTPSALSEIVLELRNLVAAVAPDSTEEIRHGGLLFYFEELGGPASAGICGMAIKPDHARLYFTQGAFILDRSHLLRGSGKAIRYMKLINFESVP